MSDPKTNEPDSKNPDAKGVPNQSADSNELPAAGQLTKEEQWALFEKELKESDWGHQPC